MRRARPLVDLALAALAILAVTARGHADPNPDPPPDPRIQKADQLFAEGKALMASNLLQACDKFDQSLHENPAAIGTLLNVALCDEKLGRVASAVAKFSEARDRAKEQGLSEHQRAAEDHLAALEPSVPHLSLQLTEPLPDTKILIDDRVIPSDRITDVAVDPGERTIVVSAPDRLPYRGKLIVARAEHKRVVIPALARSVTVRSSRRRIGQISTIVGGAALATGVGFGIYAHHLYLKQFRDGLCNRDDDRCQEAGQRNTDRARFLGNVGTGVGIAGVVAAGIGAYLWIRSPASSGHEARGKAVTVVPQLTRDGVGLTAVGRF